MKKFYLRILRTSSMNRQSNIPAPRDFLTSCKSFYLSFFIILFSGCTQQPEEFHHTILQFDTLINVTLYNVDEELAARAFASLDRDFEHYQKSWTPYEPSALTRINQLIATGKTFSVAPSVLPLITQSITLSEQTGNLYNPAIGKLIKLWQFHRHEDPDIKPPQAEEIAALVAARPQLDNLQLDGIRMYSKNPLVELNFGAFAKGYAVDMSVQHLREMGIHDAVFAVGGDIKTTGRHGDRAWRVGIRHPRQEGVIASIDMQGEEGISTSGDYERFFLYQGKRYHHILDPRTGYPAQGTQAVTVVHADSAMADVAATALFVAGPEHWFDLAKKLQLKQVMFIDENGRIQVTPEMMKRLMFSHPDKTTIQITAPL
ncbi:MAG: FAD:protein transferase [Pseudomonadota bacterium]|nr:FAD:protein transferase [Pseudomonadota bacterium]